MDDAVPVGIIEVGDLASGIIEIIVVLSERSIGSQIAPFVVQHIFQAQSVVLVPVEIVV